MAIAPCIPQAKMTGNEKQKGNRVMTNYLYAAAALSTFVVFDVAIGIIPHSLLYYLELYLPF